MDTINALVTVFGNGFFPIIVCAVLFWYVYDQGKKHKDEMDEMRKSVDNNTLTLTKLIEAIDRIKEV